MPEELLLRASSLKDRVFSLIKDRVAFNSDEVINLFPNDSRPAIYKALRDLVDDGRLSFVGYVDRKKVYTPRSGSDLPVFKGRDGRQLTMRMILQGVMDKSVMDEHYVWNAAKVVNELPIQIALAFKLAQEEDKDKLHGQFKVYYQQIIDIQKRLTWMLELIETFQKHPAMDATAKNFKTVFNSDSKDMPTSDELRDFKVWWTQYIEWRKNNG